MTVLFWLLTASLVPLAQGWAPHGRPPHKSSLDLFQTRRKSSNTRTSSLNALLDPSDSFDTFLSASDRTRLAEMRSRHVTMPIMILDAMLPGQRLKFGSPDSKFHRLIEAVLASEDSELGMIGMNPHTGRPLNMGVTLKITPDDVSVDRLGIMTIQSQATHRRFEVQGEPWLDETESYYSAHLELVDDRPEPELPEELQEQAEVLMDDLPRLVEQWLGWVLKTGKSSKKGMATRLEDIGRMPDTPCERSMWAAALVNPIPPLGVCLEVRPAMLACKNDFDRLYLAFASLQSSIDHLSGKKRLF